MAVTTSKAGATSPLAAKKAEEQKPANGNAATAAAPKLTPAQRSKIERDKRVPYRKEGDAVLKAPPTDFNGKIHLPLKRSDFETETLFLEYRLTLAQATVLRLTQAIDESKTLGTTKDRAKGKKYAAMLKRLAELESELSKDGVDIAALKEAAAKAVPAEAKPAPEQTSTPVVQA